jgi:two-component system response regulator AtoC
MSALMTSFSRENLQSIRPRQSLEEAPFKDDFRFNGVSPSMAKLHSRIARIASADVPVLLVGESGVGKEVAARRIHSLSQRGGREFLKLNCAALPAELLESELFGYEAGAFTGATKSKPGLFELAHKGTILLDEIGEVPPNLQAKLLHVLQDHRFSRLGGRCIVNVDVRILAATNVDIQQALDTKKLRMDLYYRLSTFTLHVPPLRERKEEIPHLLNHFVARFAPSLGCPVEPLPDKMLDACMRYHWPGNVRELENFVKRYLILGDEEAILSEVERTHGNRPAKPATQAHPSSNGHSSDLKMMVRDLKTQAEREAIRIALERANGKRTETARLLNISTKALLQKLRRYNLIDM